MKRIKIIIIVFVSIILLTLIGIIIHDIVVIKSDHSGECCSCCDNSYEVCIDMCCPCSKTILIPKNMFL